MYVSYLNYISILIRNVYCLRFVFHLVRATREVRPLDYIEDAEHYGGVRAAIHAEKDYMHKTQGYMTNASNSRASL